ncbi:Zn-dependent oligopeptidase, partial [Halieaceae bacterium]|nr:Zn-dependent oligopeptidase [Halieaceae bacterium]
MNKTLISCLLCVALGANAAPPTGNGPEPAVSRASDGWNFKLPGEELKALCDTTLEQARASFTAIENDTGPITLATVYGPYDRMILDLQAIRHVWYMSAVHPDPAVRDAAEACVEDYTDFDAGISLSRKFYERVAGIRLEDLAPAERRMVENQLRIFRESGVDRDQATRDRVRQLQRDITELGNTFDRTILEDTRYVDTTAEALAGLPEDFLAARPADNKGVIRISTDYPDYFPVMKYAENDELRRQLFIATNTIGSPDNSATLKNLLAKRHELARLLGYDSYAALAMDGLMIGNPDNARAFLTEVGMAAQEPAARDLAVLLERLRTIDPSADQVQPWQGSYLADLVRQEQYALDAQQVRKYFHFSKVKRGMFQLTEDLFGVDIVPWETETWHESVTAWEMRRDGQAIGRFYLDLHPREDKYKHAAHWTLRTGLKDRQLPLSGLATNFPDGLMEHSQVETFLHEFGHLLHNMFSGTQRWMDISGMAMERDFVEAPSQMLEEWIWNYDSLARFASNDKGEIIPRELVAKMNRARHFGIAMGTAQQIFYANTSLRFHDGDPAELELL